MVIKITVETAKATGITGAAQEDSGADTKVERLDNSRSAISDGSFVEKKVPLKHKEDGQRV